MTEQHKNKNNGDNAIHQIYLSSQIKDAECKLNKVESVISEKKKKKQQESQTMDQAPTLDDDDYYYNNNGMEAENQGKKQTKSAKHTLHDLSSMSAQLENLSIVHDYITSKNKVYNDNDEFETAFDDDKYPNNLKTYVNQFTRMGHVLLHHTPPPTTTTPSSTTETSYYTMLLARYKSLYQYVRAVCTKELRQFLRLCHYPLPNGCFQLKCALDEIMLNNQGMECAQDGIGGNNQHNIGSIAKYLVEIQVVNDLLEEHLHKHGAEPMKHTKNSREHCQIDLVDELFRPIVERVQFHFLSQEGGGEGKESKAGEKEGSLNEKVLSTRIDKLPQWLFEYLRNDVLECSNKNGSGEKQQDGGYGGDIGVYELVRDSLHPFISTIASDIAGTLASPLSEDECTEDNNENKVMIGVASPWYYNEATAYLLREVVHLCRHVFRARRFFRHPMIVGGYEHVSMQQKSYNPLHLCHGIEQILLFDYFIFHLLNDDVQNIIKPPKLLDVFITSNPNLFQQWMEIDREYAMSTLVSTSSSSSPRNDSGEDTVKGFDIGGVHISPSFMSPTAEVFITLVQSLHAKLDATANPAARREYVATVIIPVCTHFMDVMHETASTLRNLLVAKRRSSSTTGSSVRGRSSVLPADEDLQRNMLGWIEVIAGTHLAAVSLLGDDENNKQKGGAEEGGEEDDDLSRVGRSIARLRDAMVDECASSIVETILMERAKLAGYLMRCPFVLSSHDSDDGGGCTGVDGHQAVSPDLIESIQILSVVVPICDKVSEKMKSSVYNEGGVDENENDVDDRDHHRVADLIRHCPQSIKSSLAERLEEKMLEVALDVHGMTPEIAWVGAKQFCHDAFELAHIFGVDRRVLSTTSPLLLKQSATKGKYFDRVLDAAALMVMESAKFVSLREVLHGLVRPDGTGMSMDNSDIDGVDFTDLQQLTLHYEDFNADGTVLDEAQNMLSAKGLTFLDLKDAISIMNRRTL